METWQQAESRRFVEQQARGVRYPLMATSFGPEAWMHSRMDHLESQVMLLAEKIDALLAALKKED